MSARFTLADLPERYRKQAIEQIGGMQAYPATHRREASERAGSLLERDLGISSRSGGNAPIGRCIPAITEKELQKAAENWLRLTGCIVFHMPGRAAIGNMRGFPDILALCPGGRYLMVELKSEKGRLSPVQEVFATVARQIGHTVYLCRSMDDVQAAYKHQVGATE